MMRRIVISVLATVFVVLLIVGGLLLSIRGQGFSAHAEPSWMEKVMARNARKIATPPDAKNLKNPRQQQTEEMIREADEHFVEHCGMCHGIDGRGDTVIGKNLYPKVPDMTQAQTQQLTDGEIYYIITNGVRLTGMPAWGSEDTPEAIWDLVALIRRLPKLSPEEMKRLQEAARGSSEELAEPENNAAKEDGKSTEPKQPPKKHTHTHKH
jgi:mono/diheme cytochrome c family protein